MATPTDAGQRPQDAVHFPATATFLPEASSHADEDAAPVVDYPSAEALFSELSLQSSSLRPTTDSGRGAAAAQSGYDPVARLSAHSTKPLPRSSPPARQSTTPAAPSLAFNSFSTSSHSQQPASPPLQQPLPSTGGSRSPNRLLRQQGEAAYRQAEVERRHKLREDEKLKRQQDMQHRIEQSMAALRSEREVERARMTAEREDCARAAMSLAPGQSVDWEASIGNLDADETIGRQVLRHWQQSRPTEEAIERRQRVIDRIQHAIDKRWPDIGLVVAPFGSSVTGLVSDSSDLDLVLLDPTMPYGVGTPPHLMVPAIFRHIRFIEGLPDWYNVRVVANALRTYQATPSTFKSVTPIMSANVPIVKLLDVETGLPADLNINDRFGLINSQLIETYGNLQPELFRPFVFFLKHWLSRRDLNDPSGRLGPMSLSSYTIALLAIQYMQSCDLLPNLQDPDLIQEMGVARTYIWQRPKRSHTPFRTTAPAQGYDVTFAPLRTFKYRDRALRRAWQSGSGSGNGEARDDPFHCLLGQLVKGFIKSYDTSLGSGQAISIANGGPMSVHGDDQGRGQLGYRWSPEGVLAMDVFETPPDWARQELVVQDPFIVDRNTARNISARVMARIRGELQRARAMLCGELVEGCKVKDLPLICDVCAPTSLFPPVSFRGEPAARSAAASRKKMEELGEGEEDAAVQIAEAEAARKIAKAKRRSERRLRGKQDGGRGVKADSAISGEAPQPGAIPTQKGATTSSIAETAPLPNAKGQKPSLPHPSALPERSGDVD